MRKIRCYYFYLEDYSKYVSPFFFQSHLPAGKLCTTLPIVPKSRDPWSTFGVWHEHIQSYSSQWIIILWTELPKYCLKNRLKMFNFWFFFLQPNVYWLTFGGGLIYIYKNHNMQSRIWWKWHFCPFSKVGTFVYMKSFDINLELLRLFDCTEIIKISAKIVEFQEILKNCLPLNCVMKLMRSWIFLIPT